jgi:hypothetical protein
MHRVLKPGGRAALSLWCEIQENPYFYALVEAITQHIGREIAAGLMAAFGLSGAGQINELLNEAGFERIDIVVEQLDLQLPELEHFVPRHISATPMAPGYNAAPLSAQQAVVQDFSESLAHYRIEIGSCIPFKTHFAIAQK